MRVNSDKFVTEYMALKRIVNDDESVESLWLEKKLLVARGHLSVCLSDNDSDFDLGCYRGVAGFQRAQRISKGLERTLNRQEFAKSCAIQQNLELLICLFVMYGANLPDHALMEIGVSKRRMIYSCVGHYYAEWGQAAAEDAYVMSEREKQDLLYLQYEAQKKIVDEAAQSRELLQGFRNAYSIVEIPSGSVWRADTVNSTMGVYAPVKIVADVVPIGQPKTMMSANNSEGTVPPEHIQHNHKDDSKMMQRHASSVAVEVDAQRKLDMYAETLDTHPIVDKFEDMNETPKQVFIPETHDDGWNLTPMQISMINTYSGTVHMREQAGEIVDDSNEARVVDLILLEHMHEVAVQESVVRDKALGSVIMTSSSFKYLWDIHSYYPYFGRNVFLSVSWSGDNLGRVERILILNSNGVKLMDANLSNVDYEYRIWVARRTAHMILAGSNVFGFNVFQHISKIGMAGVRSRFVDMSHLPCLKGKFASLSTEKYQIRYGRLQNELIGRDDPMLDNLLFCVFLGRRAGFAWCSRRRKEERFLT